MKKIYLLLIILFSVFSFCQTKKSLTLPSLNSISIDSTFQIKPIIFNLKKNYDFTVYNPNLNLQYTYLKFDKKYQANSISQTRALYTTSKAISQSRPQHNAMQTLFNTKYDAARPEHDNLHMQGTASLD